jgi:acyl dehydratase
VNAGDVLPELSVEMTATRIVAGALATRDFMPVHHDRAYANAQGAPDIFMNIISTNAHCSRYLTDWAGPDAMLQRLAVRLGVPCFPGSVLTFTGSVTAVERCGAEDVVEVAFRASNALGDHATGTATLAIPAPDGASSDARS